MSEPEVDLFAQRLGSLKAPAGCGKTQLITSTLKQWSSVKPALVLTHTNAGRAALEQRIRNAGIPSERARVATLDSLAIRLVQSFPARSGLSDSVLSVRGSGANYAAIRRAAVKMLTAGHLDDIIDATYSRVVVDEYQDCSLPQHAMVEALAERLPTAVLGDPLQGIFSFSGPVVSWRDNVQPSFPALPTLSKPWRWIRAECPDLGYWLLNVVRPALLRRESVDLSNAPREVTWVPLEGTDTEKSEARLAAARKKYATGSTLIIGDGPDKKGQWKAAARCRAQMVEALDMKDFMAFCSSFRAGSDGCLDEAVDYFSNLMSGLSPQSLVTRTRSHLSGRTRTAATPLEEIALEYLRNPSPAAAGSMLEAMAKAEDTYVFRPDIVRLCAKALKSVTDDVSLTAAGVKERERYRHAPRTMPRRAVGSTLLLKGLEAENAVILEPEKMDARNLYVALTRGSKRLIICSTTSVLEPHLV